MGRSRKHLHGAKGASNDVGSVPETGRANGSGVYPADCIACDEPYRSGRRRRLNNHDKRFRGSLLTSRGDLGWAKLLLALAHERAHVFWHTLTEPIDATVRDGNCTDDLDANFCVSRSREEENESGRTLGGVGFSYRSPHPKAAIPSRPIRRGIQ